MLLADLKGRFAVNLGISPYFRIRFYLSRFMLLMILFLLIQSVSLSIYCVSNRSELFPAGSTAYASASVAGKPANSIVDMELGRGGPDPDSTFSDRLNYINNSLSFEINRQLSLDKVGFADKYEGVEILWKNRLNHLAETKLIYKKYLPDISPADGWISSLYGYRRSPFTRMWEFHKGVDIAALPGTDIVATADGIVTSADYNGGYGNRVEITHKFGYKTIYGHNDRILVKRGDIVSKGQVIALMGSTGRSTGSHLHYETILNDRHINPLKFLNR